MNKIFPINISKIKQASKNITKPLITGTLLSSCALLKKNKEDSFEKTGNYVSCAELKSKLEKKGFFREEIQQILQYYAMGDKEKTVVNSLLSLTKTEEKNFPILSFFKIKKEKPIIYFKDFSRIVQQLSKKCSDIDFVIELINLQKDESTPKNKSKKVSYWNNGDQLLQYIKGAETPKIKELMQKSIYNNLDKFSNIENLCGANLNEEAIEKFQYMQKIGIENSFKFLKTIRFRQGQTDTKEFIKKIEVLKTLTNSLDKDIYFSSANNAFSSQDWERIINTCLEKNEKKEEILETLVRLKNEDIELWEELYKNPMLKDIKAYHIANSINENNKDFILNLSKQEDFPKNILSGVAYRSTNPNNEIMKALCHDEKIDKKEILKYYDQLQAIPTVNFAELEISDAHKILNILNSYDENIKIFAKKFDIYIDQMITRLNNYIGSTKNVIKVAKEQQAKFFSDVIANSPTIEKFLKTYNFTQFGKKGLPLKYTRKEFNKKVRALLTEVTREEQTRICKHFGLIKGELGGFNGLYNNAEYKDALASIKELEIAKKVQAEINQFTLENEVLINDETTKKVLDRLIKGLPEFTTLVGKEQHDSHHYSVDIHSLLVLQRAMNNPLYEILNNSDKTILKISALLHDIGKREGIIDRGHAKTSSDYARSILEKFNLPEEIKHRIIITIDSHHWFEEFCRKTNPENSASDYEINEIFTNVRSPKDLKIFEILAKADFQSISPDFHLKRSNVSNEKDFDKYIQEKMDLLETKASNRLFKYSNFLKTTKFTTKLFPEEKVKIDGKKTTLKVLNLNKISANEDMRKYGFSCKNKEDLRFLVHMTYCDKESFNALLKITKNPLMQKLWSMSLIKPNHDTTYMQRDYGGILEGDNSNIITAYNANMSSGTRKNKDNYKYIITSNYKYDIENRSFLKEALLETLAKKGFRLSEKDYIALSRHILSSEDLNSLKNFRTNNQIISPEIIIESIEEAQEKLFVKKIQNEIVGIDLNLKALVARVERIEDCEQDFLRFARDNKLGIILI